MAMAKSAVISFTIMALFEATMAAVYDVGEDKGWTAVGNVDYKKWADGKNFRVGDTLVFKYFAGAHDVKQVNRVDFQGCNGKSPIATHTTGSDSITLKKAGPTFFICGVPGHCQVGQKLRINVQPAAAAASPEGSPAASPGGSPTTSSPAGSPGSSTPSSAESTPSSPGTTESSSPSAAPSLFSSDAWFASALLALGLAAAAL